MTRKHFKAMADALASARPERENAEAWKAWLKAVYEVSSACSGFNCNFDRDRFYSACGVPANA